jgi:hypothetical protein
MYPLSFLVQPRIMSQYSSRSTCEEDCRGIFVLVVTFPLWGAVVMSLLSLVCSIFAIPLLIVFLPVWYILVPILQFVISTRIFQTVVVPAIGTVVLVGCLKYVGGAMLEVIAGIVDPKIEGWKAAAVLLDDGCSRYVYVRLRIPKSTGIVYPREGDKLRCARAFVISITDAAGRSYKSAKSCVTTTCTPLVYEMDQWVVPDGFAPDPLAKCAKGVHFHLHKHECEQWMR